MPTSSEISSINTIEDAILPGDYRSGWSKIEYSDPNKLGITDPPQVSAYYSAYLWAKHFKIPKIPSWEGFMEVMSGDKITNIVSRIECLPFINHEPSDITTIYTSLMHAHQETQKNNQKTCIVTFDQPLYERALEIVRGLDLNIQVRLGGLQTIKVFLGAVGYTMECSGLEELWGVVYAPNSVKHMVSGHAISRAIRAHIITYTALGSTICSSFDQNVQDAYKEQIGIFFENFGDDDNYMGSCAADSNVRTMSNEFVRKLNDLKNNGPTAKLWIQYFQAITILLQFIEAERLGNWQLHLQSVRKMLPFFHAAESHQYAQCAHIYLQDMVELELKMDDDEFRIFTKEGYWTIRRTAKAFSGIPTDMTIEQTLNRFFGTDLVYRRGDPESVVARYFGAMPSCFMIMESLEEFCNIQTNNSDQQVDLQSARMKTDDEHLAKFIHWFNKHRPLASRSSLVSLSTSTMGGKEVNCHEAFEKGEEALQLMIGKKAKKIKMSCCNVVNNLKSAKYQLHTIVKNDAINATFLFEQISSSLENEIIAREALQYELSPYPLSLFTTKGFMRQPDESFYQVIKRVDTSINTSYLDLTLVIDGNYLVLNAVSSWPHGKTYQDICELYLNYLKQKYPHQFNVRKLYIVFERYTDDVCGAKSYAQYRENNRNIAADFYLDSKAFVNLTKEEFLTNICNKIGFVQLLSNFLQDKINVIMTMDDCTKESVNTALQLKTLHRSPVGVLSDNVDIMILLITLTPDYEKDMFFCKVSLPDNRIEFCRTFDYLDVRSFLLLVHTFCGCETTSAIYNKGKSGLLKLIESDVDMQNVVRVFYQPLSSASDICTATEKLMLSMYKASSSQTQSLNDMRYERFVGSSSSGGIEKRLAMLPPSLSAAQEHGKRVFYQLQKWIGNFSLQPQEWGWRRLQTILIPVMTPDPPAPATLCEMIYCGCSTTRCQTKQCKCKKAGVRCTTRCKHCKGSNCTNAASISHESNASREGDADEEEEESDSSTDDEESTEVCTVQDVERQTAGPSFQTWASVYDFDDSDISYTLPYDSF